MKSEKMKKFQEGIGLNLSNIISRDFSSSIIKRVDIIEHNLCYKSLDYDTYIVVIMDSLKTLETKLRSIGWSSSEDLLAIEKDWLEQRKKLANLYPKNDNNKILPRYLKEYVDAKCQLDFQYLLSIAIDIGVIPMFAQTITEQSSNDKQ